jgi:competence protein ComFC
LDLLFPKLCLRCGTEGDFLCPDCQATLDILESNFCLCQRPSRLPFVGKCRFCREKRLAGLYFALSYKNNLVKNLVGRLKYEPSAKELAKTLALLIITHFNLIQKTFEVENHLLVPVPLAKKKLRRRGFNQSEEIAKVLSENLKIPMMTNILLKNRETKTQMKLSREERTTNIKDAFFVENKELLKDKEILLVDDVYTTGATMEECVRVLKRAGAKAVWGVAVAREE